MKNWFAPLAILGLSGLGLACASTRVQARMRDVFEHLAESPDPFGEVNRFFDEQLANIQHTLDRLAEALEEQEA
jgi:hypothetical protein